MSIPTPKVRAPHAKSMSAPAVSAAALLAGASSLAFRISRQTDGSPMRLKYHNLSEDWRFQGEWSMKPQELALEWLKRGTIPAPSISECFMSITIPQGETQKKLYFGHLRE